MKKFLSFFMVTIIFSCNTKQPEKDVTAADTTIAPIATDTVSTSVIKDSHYFWSSDIDPKKGLVMIKNRPLPADSLTEANIIQLLNKQYPEIRLSFSKISNDSIFLKITKSNYLTQQMGSSGADSYLAEVTFNCTELKGINFVDIRFKEGDHASPGTYSRTDFVQER